MKNKTFLSSIQIISTTFDKKIPISEQVQFLRDKFGSASQNNFGAVHCTQFCDVCGAKETYFKYV